MSINLPKSIGSYFMADSTNGNNIVQCFTENAIVKDEKQTYQGRDAIRRWKSDITKKFTYKTEPFDCEERGGKTIVTSKLTGSFPGSPIELRYIFGLEGGKIAYLEITP